MNYLKFLAVAVVNISFLQFSFADIPKVPPENPVPPEEFLATVAKSLDGSVVYCERGMPSKAQPGQKVIMIQKSNDYEDDDNYNVGVESFLVSCRNYHWVADSDPFREEYRVPTGEVVTVTYDTFEVFVKDSAGKVIYSGKVREISRSGFHRMTLKFKKTRAPEANYEIFFRAMKSVYVNNEFQWTEYVPFGSFNIRLQAGTRRP